MKKTSMLFLSITSLLLFNGCKSNTKTIKSDEKKSIKINNSIEGKILAGYQGWFNAKGDGSGLTWKHYANSKQFNPGNTSVDFWPDVSELDKDELFKTEFVHKDGEPAYVFIACLSFARWTSAGARLKPRAGKWRTSQTTWRSG